MSSPAASLYPGSADQVQAAPKPIHWTATTRVAFRFSFVYFLVYLLCNGNATIFQSVPVAGQWMQQKMNQPFSMLAEWLGVHVFRLTGFAATWHGGGSGDTALHWITVLSFLSMSAVATLVWSVFDRRKEYQTLYAWLRFLIRLTLGVGMLVYGFAKLFPLQMQPPSLAVLNEPLGETSPMTMLWTLIAISPKYEMVCGAAELAGGLLILFRRTALLGALMTAFVMTNVVLYNFFFDVPVKLYAAHLLLMALFVTLPDVKALFSFFWLHRPAAPAGVWVPPATRPAFRRATAIVEAAFLLSCLIQFVSNQAPAAQKLEAARHVVSPVIGAWRLDPAPPATQWNTGSGSPAVALYVDNARRGAIRSADGQLWRAFLELDSAKHTLSIRQVGSSVTYTWQSADANHLTLTPTGKLPKLTFTRIPVPNQYPLLTRGFHLISEWGYER